MEKMLSKSRGVHPMVLHYNSSGTE
jgi:hypothetical protein